SAVINVDLADVWAETGRKKFLRTLAWGDSVEVTKQTASGVEIETVYFNEQPDGSILPVKKSGFIEPTKSSGIKVADLIRPLDENEVLKVNCVDVQQGDGSVIESPDGKVILVDGGDNQMFARYLAARYRGTTADNPKEIACILVTHGDADHFLGLPEILKSETNKEKRKRLFIQPKRYYHNGIVKRPSTRPEIEQLGPTKKVGKQVFLTGLENDLLAVPDSEMNAPFRAWKDVLEEYNTRSKMEFRRLQFGDNDAFAFFNQGDLRIEVLGPLVTEVEGKPALRFLGNPPKGPRVGHESLNLGEEGFTGLSASHTINGHSVVFRLIYGGFSYLFTGDLNDEASRFLTREHNAGHLNLRSEVFKVPHHGSADFSGALFQAVSPVVSIVSSGDESARKEFIHPRATLIGALGKWARVPEPLIFVTELVAFFNVEGWSRLANPKTKEEKKRGTFFGFSRTAYGIVKTRTNGKRLLVYTDSGDVQMKEAYAYELDSSGVPQPAVVARA
ncbi:MAG TPA: MBL fold metallo-hydrolase, partial [Chthoniobacterales bacterium]|nr:MBL fold metallo-hydrolase [Chthoniobacterales bacterium]